MSVLAGNLLIVGNSDNQSGLFMGGISGGYPPAGGGTLAKEGGGTLVLSGSGTYTGGTYVESGTLEATNRAAIADGTGLFVGANLARFGTVVPVDAGSSSAVAPAAAPVPEPGTLALVAAAVALVSYRWRRMRGRRISRPPSRPARAGAAARG